MLIETVKMGSQFVEIGTQPVWLKALTHGGQNSRKLQQVQPESAFRRLENRNGVSWCSVWIYLTFTKNRLDSYIRLSRIVTAIPTGVPSLSLKPAMDFRALVVTGL